jgi:hypothetical protein
LFHRGPSFRHFDAILPLPYFDAAEQATFIYFNGSELKLHEVKLGQDLYEVKHIRSSSNLAMWRRELAVAFTSGNADALHASMFTVCIP